MVAQSNYCPSECSCTSTLTCRDLGEQSRVPDLTAVFPSTFSSVQFVGRTRIRTIQTRSFSRLSVQQMRLGGLGVGVVESEAFLGVLDLLEIDVSHNHIGSEVDSGTFAVESSLRSLDVSDNDVDVISGDAFSLAGNASLVDLRLAGNRLAVLPDRLFSNLSHLDYLDLSGNRLTSLSQSLFGDLRSLKSLLLANNRISHMDPTTFDALQLLDRLALENNQLTSLPASLFGSLSSLRTLTLQGNRLSAVQSDVFPTSPSSLLTLKLDRNRIANLDQIEMSSLSSLMTLTLTANRLTTIPSASFVGLGNITFLDLSRNRISGSLRLTSMNGLTSLQTLNLSGNKIRYISPGTFGGSLRYVDLSENDVESLGFSTFDGADDLTNLSLRKNGIRSISRGTFKRLLLLEDLDLSDNIISDINSGSFEDLPSLRRVDLSKNDISSISIDVFVNTSQLLRVALDENRLSKIPADILGNLSNLVNFSLSHNDIGKLEAQPLTVVERLNLTGNHISDIVDGAFANASSNFRELYLAENQLTTIRRTMFTGLNYLYVLDLSDNLISTVEAGSFQSLELLQDLSLHGNRIASIEPTMFSGLHSITTLVLSANRLVSHITDALPLSLQSLILDDNDIVSFDLNFVTNRESAVSEVSLRRNGISRLPRLPFDSTFGVSFYSVLDFGENRLTDEVFYGLQHMANLHTLKLDGNAIASVPTVGSLNGSLTYLDLSYNALTDSSLATILQLRQLQQLRLDGNLIGNVSAADWSLVADSLTVLSLSGNRLTSLDMQIGKLWSLTQLNVANNRIAAIPDATFRPLYDLDVLSLRGNRLTTVSQLALEGLESAISQLDLSSNYIRFVDSKAFSRLKRIKRLNLSNNAIAEVVLPPIMDQLTELLLNNNRLAKFPDDLRDFRSISVLDLSSNRLESLPAVDVGNENGVRLVDLSVNRLSNVNQIRFVGWLNAVNLSRNELTEIGADVLADAAFIGALNVSDNEFEVLPIALASAEGRISSLYADRCALASLDNWAIQQTPRLTEMTFSGNRLASLTLSIFVSVTTLLDVRGNLLTSLPRISPDHPLPDRMLLSGNPWHCDCRLASLRQLRIVIDNATCWSPSTETDQHVICYEVDHCLDVEPAAYEYEGHYYGYNYYNRADICETVEPTPEGTCISKHLRVFFYRETKHRIF